MRRGSLKPDVFLGAHGSFINLGKKLEKRKADSAVNPFIDAAGYQSWLARMKAQFEARLIKDSSKVQEFKGSKVRLVGAPPEPLNP